ncbi:MAG: class IV adenylate cyclase [Candidatus Komeilibacteria bacterium]|nr:class IV adenylate cyclase [Candidatus Komeilibacteria bacterium]
MNHEIEIKFRVRNKPRFLRRLKKLGITLREKKHLLDLYYSPPGKKFIGRNPRLRIRKNMTTGTASFEYHQPVGLYGGEETEVTISDGDMMDLILRQFKFREEARVDKVRTVYEHREMNVDLDEVKGLGTFVEIEIMNAKNKTRAVKEIKKAALELGLSLNDIENNRYLEMMLTKRR